MTQYTIKPDILLQKVADEMVLLEPVSGEYFTLNEVGAIIVEKTQQGESVESIVASLVEEFDVTPEQAKADSEGLLRQLVEQGLAESH